MTSGCRAQDARQQGVGHRTPSAGRQDGRTQDRETKVQGWKSVDGSPMDGNSWTEVRQMEVQRTKIDTATSEVTTSQLARELCGNGDGNVELQQCKLALLQHCKLAAL